MSPFHPTRRPTVTFTEWEVVRCACGSTYRYQRTRLEGMYDAWLAVHIDHEEEK